MTAFHKNPLKGKTASRGFTLVEVCVTIAILAILLGAAVIGVAGYNRYAKFKKQNEYARALFLAAQTQLTQDAADGRTEDLLNVCGRVNQLSNSGSILYKLINADGLDVTVQDIWQSSKVTDPIGTLYYLTGTAQDYAAYEAGTLTDERLTALYDLLDAYLYDHSILRATVCVELDPEDATVYSVLYSQSAPKGFTYTGEKGRTDICDRTETARKKTMVGYYGVDTLSHSFGNAAQKPVIQTVLLNNNDTLNLTWNLSKLSEYAGQLTYTVEVYDAETKNCILQIKFNNLGLTGGNDLLVSADSLQKACTIQARVYRAAAQGELPVLLGEYAFPAWLDKANSIHLVLDGADLGATEAKYVSLCAALTKNADVNTVLQGNSGLLTDTFSLHRFLPEQLGTQNIYCKVRGEATGNFKQTAAKTSNTENMYFGSYAVDKNTAQPTAVYTLYNARHLYNMRYSESGALAQEEETTAYSLTADFAWNGKGGFIAAGSLYLDKTSAGSGWTTDLHGSLGKTPLVATANTDFPSISQLRQTASFSAVAGVARTISGLSMTLGTNAAAAVPGLTVNQTAADKTGLFLENAGRLENFALKDVRVEGKNAVGAFCGINSGTLNSLEVKSGEVFGTTDVGGITGRQEPDKKASLTYASLTNRATVVGHTNVGGITGRFEPDNGNDYSVTLTNCRNYGPVRGDWNAKLTGDDDFITQLYQENKETEPEAIGGIVGRCVSPVSNKGSGNGTILLESCTSAPQYTEQELQKLFAALDNSAEVLRGTYVGGIVGYAEGAILTDCNTVRSGDSASYVVGGSYVGGIVGFRTFANSIQTDEGLVGGTNEAHVLGRNYVGGTNEAHVLGRSYVGGIVGGNILGDKSKVYPILKGWVNKGVVLATESYAGGITGKNTGIVTGCASQTDYDTTAQKLLAAFGRTADYVGGLVGYNAGTVESADLPVYTVVQGRDYVGGIIGYQTQDAESSVQDCTLQGGYLFGRDFVGGYVGLNLSANAASQTLHCAPGQVDGRYFVGGCFGACLLDSTSDCTYIAQNYLGTIEGKMYVGGYAGLYALAKDPAAAAEKLIGLEDISEASAQSVLLKNMQNVETVFADFDLTDTLTLDGQNSYTRFGSIKGYLYVGGIVGCVPATTNAVFKDLINESPVTALMSLASQELGASDTLRYSYVGGIVGEVEKGTSLLHCQNAGTGEMHSAGSLSGGLTEINRGRIIACTSASLGSVYASNVGGIVSLNLASGAASTSVSYQNTSYSEYGIFDCTATGTVTGVDYCGGIAARNYGLIRNTSFDNLVLNVSGRYVGGITGLSDTATVRGSELSSGFTEVCSGMLEFTGTGLRSLHITVNGTGSYVGALAGECSNGGFRMETNAALKLDGSSSVTGTACTGGFFGRVSSSSALTLKNLKNYAAVSAQTGTVGGIAAETSANVTLSNCFHYGSVEVKVADQNGSALAGGLVAQNGGNIIACGCYGTVKAGKGFCGGITAVNTGTISTCQVGRPGDLSLSFTGDKLVGGVTGKNSGSILSSYVYGLTLTNQASSVGGSIGGIAAENTGTISACAVGASFANSEVPGGEFLPAELPAENGAVTLISQTNDITAGGITGRNTGSVTGAKDYQTQPTVTAKLRFADTALGYYGNLGGIVGLNSGSISLCSFSGSVAGTANNPALSPTYDPNTLYESGGAVIYGYGGIAGVNGASDSNTVGSIKNCFVMDASVTGIGDPNNIVNVGGIAGVNGVGGTIDTVDFGSGASQSAATGNANSFLLANGTLTKNNSSSTFFGSVLVKTTAYGHTGGVAGYNMGGITQVCPAAAGTDFATSNPASSVLVLSSRGHVGGITGYNRPTGAVSFARTGRSWFVFAAANAQDNGCGGVIGYNASQNDIISCANWATVVKTVGSSNGAGGIIGRCEIATASTVRLTDCLNYGNISANDRCGGMIGILKYRSLIFDGCKNYGCIRSSYAGGMLGMLYGVIDTSKEIVYFNNCENHGTIGINKDTNYVGGIMGAVSGSGGNVTAKFYRCINTGLICGTSDNSAGIVGQTKSLSNSVLSYCINYGSAYSGKSQTANGISPNGSNLTFSSCVGVAPLTYPISNSSKTNVGYFFGTGAGCGQALTVAQNETGKYNAFYSLSNKEATVFPDLSLNPTQLSTQSGYSNSDALIVRGSSEDNPRYAYFAQINSQLLACLSQNETAGAVTKLTLLDKGGSYTASWTGTADYYTADISFTKDGVTTTNKQTVYEPTLRIDTAGHAGATLAVTVTPYTFSDKPGTPASISTLLGEMLPTPQVHFELSGTSTYKVVLDNQNDFVRFCEKRDIELSDITIQVSTLSNDAKTFKFSADKIEANATYTTNKSGTRFITAQASSTNAYADSSFLQSRESMFLVGTPQPANVYLNSASDNANGFLGTSQTSLSYRLTIKYSNLILYMRSEMMAVDSKLGVPVSLSNSLLRVSDTAKDSIPTLLSGLPADLFTSDAEGQRNYTSLYVRSYPYMMSNNIVYMGHAVALPEGKTALSRAELIAAYVTDTGTLSDAATGKKLIDPAADSGYTDGLKNGYVIERIGDDRYTLYYNMFTNKATLDDIKGSLNKTSWKNPLAYCYLGEDLQLQPVPDIRLELTADASQLTVSWDSVSTETDYSYTVTGTLTASDGTQETVPIESGTLANKTDGIYANNRYTLPVYNTAAWPYSTVTVEVTRNAQTNATGVVQRHAVTGTADIPLQKRLSTLTQPTVELHRSESGGTLKDDLIYDISWAGLTDETELANLFCYEVTVISIPADETQTAVTRRYRTSSADYAASASATSLTGVNLNEFNGKVVTVSVRALAKGDTYLSGSNGDTRRMTLPMRLTMPDLSGMFTAETALNTATDGTEIIPSVREFEETGFALAMKGTTDFNSGYSGKYQLALGIFDAKDGTELVRLYDESAPVTMTGDFLSSVYALRALGTNQFNASYANQWVRVSARTISDQQISSVWTSAQSSYAFVHLPRVRTDSVSLNAGTSVGDVLQWKDGQPLDDQPINHLQVSQNFMSFAAVPYASGYRLTLLHTATTQNGLTGSHADWLTLNAGTDDDGSALWEVHWHSTDPAEGKTYTIADTLLGTLKPGQTLTLPYTAVLTELDGVNNPTGFTAPLAASIACALDGDGQTVFTLVVPDTESVTNSGGSHYENINHNTVSVAVQTLAVNENYTDSYLACWYRYTNGGEESWNTASEVKPTDALATTVTGGASAQPGQDAYYTVPLTSLIGLGQSVLDPNCVYVVQMTDTSEKDVYLPLFYSKTNGWMLRLDYADFGAPDTNTTLSGNLTLQNLRPNLGYGQSLWSTLAAFTLTLPHQQLAAPVLTVDETSLRFSPVPDATSYAVTLDSNATLLLTPGETSWSITLPDGTNSIFSVQTPAILNGLGTFRLESGAVVFEFIDPPASVRVMAQSPNYPSRESVWPAG